MGIFNKKEEEVRLKYLINAVDVAAICSKISIEAKKYLVSYIDNICKGGVNDFGDIDTLYEVMERIIESDLYTEYDVKYHFDKVIELYKKIVGDNSSIKTKFIESFVGSGGLISKNLYDDYLYSIFTNKNDYFEIMIIIRNSPKAIENFDIVKGYIKSVCKYCLNQDILKRDIISFVSGLDTIIGDNYEEYSRKEKECAKRRVGIYNISPKNLAECDSKLRKIQDYFEQFNIFSESLNMEKDTIRAIVDNGKEKIETENEKSVKEFRRMIFAQKKVMMDKLDCYLLELEEQLKDQSESIFRQFVENYKNQIDAFKNLFKVYLKNTSDDLIALQKSAEESVSKLEDYVLNEPQVQLLLTKAQEQNEVREKLIELVSKEKEVLEKFPEFQKNELQSQVILSDSDRIIVPNCNIVLPDKTQADIIPAFNSAIPFDIRVKKIEEQMKLREDHGEIFHKKVKDIVLSIMEGDWPYLWGLSGNGKSFIIKQVASLLGITLTKAGKITEPHSVLGYNDSQGKFRTTPTFMATLYGYLLSLDEFNNIDSDAQVVLNDIYSELLNKLEDPDSVCRVIFGMDISIDIHPNFRMIAAGNTSILMENSSFYAHIKMDKCVKIDESVQKKITPIYIDYDDGIEERILGSYPGWYKFLIKFRTFCKKYSFGTEEIPTIRDVAFLKKYIEHNSKTVDQIIAEKFVHTKNQKCCNALVSVFSNLYGFEYDQSTDIEYTADLKNVDEKILAKKLINICKEREKYY